MKHWYRDFLIPIIEHQNKIWQLIFIVKFICNSDDKLPTKLLTACCNQKRQYGGVLNTKNSSIIYKLCLIIPELQKKLACSTHVRTLSLMANNGTILYPALSNLLPLIQLDLLILSLWNAPYNPLPPLLPPPPTNLITPRYWNQPHQQDQ